MAGAKREGEIVVYSTEHGRLCLECQAPLDKCVCKQRAKETLLGDGKIKVQLERKGRGGKSVTTVAGLAMNETQLKDLAGELKKVCGAGGSVKDGVIEIQGERVDFIKQELRKRGILKK